MRIESKKQKISLIVSSNFLCSHEFKPKQNSCMTSLLVLTI